MEGREKRGILIEHEESADELGLCIQYFDLIILDNAHACGAAQEC